MLSLSELPECVEDFIVSDLDLERVDKHVIKERMTAYANSAALNIGDPGCAVCPCFQV